MERNKIKSEDKVRFRNCHKKLRYQNKVLLIYGMNAFGRDVNNTWKTRQKYIY